MINSDSNNHIFVNVSHVCPVTHEHRTIFRQALVTGDRNIMNHIFYYLLTHLTELKQRAYLAKFLVKIEVSPDVEGDQDIVQLYEQVSSDQIMINIISFSDTHYIFFLMFARSYDSMIG